jgi:peptidoglycan/LPS O-acetylase OafA/YrhL
MTDQARAPLPTSTTLRPALALLAGLGITVLIVFVGVTITTLAALSDVNPKEYVAPFWTYPTHLAISALGAMAGGFATARITIGRSLFTTLVLALILLMSALTPVLRGTPGGPGQPSWYPLSLAIASSLGALLGGILERRHDRGASLSSSE